MKYLIILTIAVVAAGCDSPDVPTEASAPETTVAAVETEGKRYYPDLAEEVKQEALRTWNDYKQYAWTYDVLLPLSKQGFNWYEETLGISPFDAYSTLKVLGLEEEAREVLDYALDMDWDKDVYVQVFEVNIRILGGLLSMYHYSQNPQILDKARDFGDRLLPAFATETGIPTHSVNLRSGKTAGNKGEGTGEVVNVAQAASYLFEFGILSYYTRDPKYYQAAKKATLAVFNRKSDIGLVGENINVRTGAWEGTQWSHLQAGVDSYYEYMYKSYLIFRDPEIKALWDFSIEKINRYLGEEYDGQYFYTVVDMHNGNVLKRSVSLYDAFFPAVQAIAGQVEAAERNQRTWHWLWNKHRLLFTRYHYEKDEPEYANWELNPEIIESAYYLHEITGKPEYMDMVRQYWADIKQCCRHEVGYHSIEDARTKEPKDYMPTFFIAETLKYFYIAFAGSGVFDFDNYIFSTEAHTFKKDSFDPQQAKIRLGF